MSPLRSLWAGLRALFQKKQVEQEMDEELNGYLDAAVKDKMRSGMSKEEALRAARVEMGSVDAVKEEIRSASWESTLETLWQDVRYGLRKLSQTPRFTCFAVLILALGIGCDTAMFSVVNTVLLRPLPYPHDDRLILVTETIPRERVNDDQVGYPLFLDWRQHNHALEAIGSYFSDSDTVQTANGPLHVQLAYASADYFTALGGSPQLGRAFTAQEDQPAGDRAVVLSDAWWHEQFGASRSVLGGTLKVGELVYTVVGVMPANFDYASPGVKLWLPLGSLARASYMRNRDVRFLTVVGRLWEGTSITNAVNDLNTIQARAQQAFPGTDSGHGTLVRPLRDYFVGSTGYALLLLSAAVVFLLLVVCANMAGLELERAAARRHEFAVRTALGAPRHRIVRQVLTEIIIVALLGGAVGLLVGRFTVSLLSSFVRNTMPMSGSFTFDVRVWCFGIGISALVGLATGLGPALSAARSGVAEKLKQTAATTTASTGRQRLRRIFTGAEIALTVVLLCGAGLLIRTLYALLKVDPGFRTDHLLTMTVSLPEGRYATQQSIVGFFKATNDRLGQLPGVEQVSAVSSLPIQSGEAQGQLTIENRPFRLGEAPSASFRRVLPNYFRVMGIRVLSGREFSDVDQGKANGAPMVVLINERMAHSQWPDHSPLGVRIKLGPPENEPWLTIVGVVADVHNTRLELQPGFATYEPLAQRPRTVMTFVIRTDLDPTVVAAAAQVAVHQREPEAPVFDVMSMDQLIGASVTPQRINATLLGSFAAMALLLAATGIYGTISFTVGQRTHEIGLRMALGAQRRDVMNMIVGEALRLTGVGIVTGLLIAAAAAQAIQALLFGVRPDDPLIFVTASAVLAAAALLASYIPARRATKVDPMVALRYE
ncbi:MAG TPA: ABC transporter permease [Terriglobia bacterium]|nr:ABC transporter permease [Terriglobia bacterium]